MARIWKRWGMDEDSEKMKEKQRTKNGKERKTKYRRGKSIGERKKIEVKMKTLKKSVKGAEH